MSRLGIVEAIEAYYLTLVVDALHQSDVLRTLAEGPAGADSLARGLALSPELLTPLLDFAALKSDLVVKEDDGSFRLSEHSRTLAFVEHMLDQYVGGYGPPLGRLQSLLKGSSSGAHLVDKRRHARAFAGRPGSSSAAETMRLILEFGATGILDLGCGGGQLLCDAAVESPDLRGLGVDSNPEVAAEARERARAMGVDDRVEIVCGDALAAIARQNPGKLAGIQLVVASSVLNGYWESPGDMSAFLRELALLLPGRVLIIADYYSHLGRGAAPGAKARTLIHDVAQLVSGQGLPPPSHEGWGAAYDEAGGELLHRFEATADGIDRFVHIIALPG